MSRDITEDEFDDLLRSFRRSAFRFETRDEYALGYERADFGLFLAGHPVPPPELDWWRPWLDQIARLTREGRHVIRVRVLAEPPTDYQRWEIWGARWNTEAGEQISYLPRSRALALGLMLRYDWWLLDDEQLIITYFGPGGEITRKELTTDEDRVALHRMQRDTALRHASTAADIAA